MVDKKAVSSERAAALDEAIAVARQKEKEYWAVTAPGAGPDAGKTPQWYMAKAAAAGEIAHALEEMKK